MGVGEIAGAWAEMVDTSTGSTVATKNGAGVGARDAVVVAAPATIISRGTLRAYSTGLGSKTAIGAARLGIHNAWSIFESVSKPRVMMASQPMRHAHTAAMRRPRRPAPRMMRARAYAGVVRWKLEVGVDELLVVWARSDCEVSASSN